MPAGERVEALDHQLLALGGELREKAIGVCVCCGCGCGYVYVASCGVLRCVDVYKYVYIYIHVCVCGELRERVVRVRVFRGGSW